MGLFGSSTKTYYSSTSTILFDKVEPITKQTVVGAITQNRNIAADLVANLVNGISFQARRLYNFARAGSYKWGLPEGSSAYFHPQTADYVKQAISLELKEPVTVATVVVDVDPASTDIIYNAQYYLHDPKNGEPTGSPLPWTYNVSDGTYPLLNLDFEDVADVSPYMPIIPIRINGSSKVDPSDPDRQDVINACRFISVDAEDLADAIAEQAGDPSAPDGNPVEDVYIVAGVEIADDTIGGMEYLFRFFNLQEGKSKMKKEDYDYWENSDSKAAPPMNRVTIADANYKMELGWKYITRELVTGNLNEEYARGYIPVGTTFLPGSTTDYMSDDIFWIRRRISNTQYEELKIVGLVHANWAIGRELFTTLEDAFNDPDGVGQCFIVPMRIDITAGMRATRLHDMMYGSLRLVLNDVYKVKLKWYQTDFFQFFLTIVLIAVSVVFPPASWGVAAFSAGALGYSLLTVMTMRLLTPILSMALENIVGEEFAQLVANIVAAVVAGQITGFAATSLDFSSVLTFQNISAFGFKGVQALQSMRFEDALQDITAEIQAINELLEDYAEEEADLLYDKSIAHGAISDDSYNIMAPNHYVANSISLPRTPLLITDEVHYYTDVMKYIDRPDTYIRTGAEL